MAAESSRSRSSADSYIGSLISLTSKSEMRYEGVLYNINTEESSIGLRNVLKGDTREADVTLIVLKRMSQWYGPRNLTPREWVNQRIYHGSGVKSVDYFGPLIPIITPLFKKNKEKCASNSSLRKIVRSFGTEGRKKDGPQVPPSDKVYEYILFRGSDIKDLQVKSSPPVQTSPPINNDPAIIQSHYPQPAATSSSLPSVASSSLPDVSSHTAQLGHPGSSFQGGLPLYQPGGNLGSWGPSPPPPSANGSGLAMPMYWQGFYGPPNGLPQLHQQSLLRPPPGLAMPPLQQPMQYSGFNPSLPPGASNLPGSNIHEYPSPLVSATTSSVNLPSLSLPASTLPSVLPPAPSITLPPETLPSSIPSKAPNTALPTATLSANLPALSPLISSSPDTNAVIPPLSNKPNVISGPTLPYQTKPQPISSLIGTSSSSQTETPTPSLVTPGQLLQPGPSAVSSSQSSHAAHKDVEVVQVSSTSSEPSVPVSAEAQPPILPLPQPSRSSQKLNGAPFQSRHGYRGRERGRGTGGSRPVTKFTEEFDFSAMNEKFKKDEVWGHLGKSNKSHLKDKEEDGNGSDEGDSQDEGTAQLAKFEINAVYNKDDFFDSLSCNALNHESNNGRTRFSEQRKIDTETFGDFSRYRGSRGGRWGGRGGGRFRGGGTYYGRGYGYMGRGRGRGISTHTP